MAKKTSSRSGGSKQTADVKLTEATRICVFYGPQEMLKQEKLRELSQALEAAHGPLQTFHHEGKSAELAEVLDELRTFSLMGQYKLVIVENADEFAKRYRPSLERYAQQPVDHATLVLRSESWNRGKLDTLIAQVGAVIKCEIADARQAKAWVGRRAEQAYQTRIVPAAAELLVERLGEDLQRLDSELGKLALMVEPGGSIQRDMVEELVGQSSEEQAWAIQEAVLRSLAAPPSRREAQVGRAAPAIVKLRELIDLAGQPDVLTLYFVADLIRKLYLAKRMQRQGMARGTIGRELKLFGSREKLFMDALNRLGEQRISDLFDLILRLDLRSKSGLGDARRNLEAFCATL